MKTPCEYKLCFYNENNICERVGGIKIDGGGHCSAALLVEIDEEYITKKKNKILLLGAAGLIKKERGV
ncbi:MAG: hypothetical protein LBP62_00810 [Clostridiales bacterium]|jgi:hypothetical protein|nr:hypothetical protein [Clostridiales bacterium]